MLSFRCVGQLVIASAAVTSCLAAGTEFSANIQPILSASCVPCHYGAKASLSLDSAEAVAKGADRAR
jgi:hypothetical protein